MATVTVRPRAGESARAHYTFDPFAVSPLLRLFKERRGRYMLAAVIAALLLLTTGLLWRDGVLGSTSDFTPIDEATRIFGDSELTGQETLSYPFLRDIAALTIIAIMVAQVFILRMQWRLFAKAFEDLVKTGTIIDEAPEDRGAATVGPTVPGRLRGLLNRRREQRLGHGLSGYVRGLSRVWPITQLWPFLVAAGTGYFFIQYQNKGLFESLLPTEVDQQVEVDFVARAHDNWWAGADHPIGQACGIVLAALAVYVVLIQTIGGSKIVGALRDLPRVARVDADWLNGDGWFGWRPVHRIFNTVYWTQSLYGILVTILFVTLPIGGGILPGLAWVAFNSAWILGPLPMFRSYERQAKTRRIGTLRARGSAVAEAGGDLAPIVAEIERIRTAKMNPMRIGTFKSLPVLASALLPLALELLDRPLGNLLTKL